MDVKAYCNDPQKLALDLLNMKPKKARKSLNSILTGIKDPAEAEALLQALCDKTENFIADCDAKIVELELGNIDTNDIKDCICCPKISEHWCKGCNEIISNFKKQDRVTICLRCGTIAHESEWGDCDKDFEGYGKAHEYPDDEANAKDLPF